MQRIWSIKYTLAAVIWLFIVCLALFYPSIPTNRPSLFAGFDKVVHFCLFAPLSFLGAMAFRENLRKVSDRSLFFFLGLFAVGSELIQSQYPDRTGDWLDAVFNLAGLAFGIFCFEFFIRGKKKEL